MIAKTPSTPYYAVIFTSIGTEVREGYESAADRMLELAKEQKGYLGIESAKEEIGITVSYWSSLESIRKWKLNAEHLMAQEKGRKVWYQNYKTRICLVERDYEFNK
jgi:heme-degrading monooxygenase HmoA